MERSRSIRAGVATLGMVAVLLWAPAAAGQSQSSAVSGPLTTTSVLGSIAIGTGVAITVLMFSSDGESDSKEAFLRRHRFALRRGIAVGGGEGVDLLAEVIGIDRASRSNFGVMLRDRRDVLLPLIRTGRIDSGSAEAFFHRVATGLQADPELRDAWSQRSSFVASSAVPFHSSYAP